MRSLQSFSPNQFGKKLCFSACIFQVNLLLMYCRLEDFLPSSRICLSQHQNKIHNDKIGILSMWPHISSCCHLFHANLNLPVSVKYADIYYRMNTTFFFMCSTSTSSPNELQVEGEVGSRPIGYVYNLPIKKITFCFMLVLFWFMNCMN